MDKEKLPNGRMVKIMARLNTNIPDVDSKKLDKLKAETGIEKRAFVTIALRELWIKLGVPEDVMKNPSLQ